MQLNSKKWKKKILKITMKKVEKSKKIIYNVGDFKIKGKNYEYTFMWKWKSF